MVISVRDKDMIVIENAMAKIISELHKKFNKRIPLLLTRFLSLSQLSYRLL
jgi:hypothetical protein